MTRRPIQPWGINIKRLLDAGPRTATEVAALAEMSNQQLSNLYKEPNPQVRQLRRVADALGVDLFELFRADSREAPTHEHPSVPIQADALALAIRGAFVVLLTDILQRLGEPPTPADEPSSGAHAAASANGGLSARHRGTLRRPRAG